MINPNIKIGVLAGEPRSYQQFIRHIDYNDMGYFVYIGCAEDLDGIQLDTIVRLGDIWRNKSYDTRFWAYLKASLKDQNIASTIRIPPKPPWESWWQEKPEFPNSLPTLESILKRETR